MIFFLYYSFPAVQSLQVKLLGETKLPTGGNGSVRSSQSSERKDGRPVFTVQWLRMTSPAEAGSSCMFYFDILASLLYKWDDVETQGPCLFMSVVFICKLSDELPTCPGWTSPSTWCQQVFGSVNWDKWC